MKRIARYFRERKIKRAAAAYAYLYGLSVDGLPRAIRRRARAQFVAGKLTDDVVKELAALNRQAKGITLGKESHS